MRVASKVENLPIKFGHAIGLWVLELFAMYTTHGRCRQTDKSSAYCPLPYGRGIINAFNQTDVTASATQANTICYRRTFRSRALSIPGAKSPRSELSLPVRGAKGANELPCQFRASTLLRRRAIKRVNSPPLRLLGCLAFYTQQQHATHVSQLVCIYPIDGLITHSLVLSRPRACLVSSVSGGFFFWATKSDVDVRGAIQQGVGTAT